MKIKNNLITLLLLLLIISACTATPNLISNYSFEDELEGWEIKKWSPGIIVDSTTEKALSGEHSLRIIVKKENEASVYQSVDVKPNTYYQLSGWIKTKDIQIESGGARVGIYYSFHSTDGLIGTNDWTNVEMNFRTGPDQNKVAICVRIGQFGNLASGTAYFDNIRMVELKEKPATFKDSIDEDKSKTGPTPKPKPVKESAVHKDGENTKLPYLGYFIFGNIIFLIIYTIGLLLIIKSTRKVLLKKISALFKLRYYISLVSPVKEKLISSVLLGLFFVIFLFWFGPLILYFNNMNEFNFFFSDLLVSNIIISLILVLTLTVVLQVINHKIYKYIVVILFSTGILLWLQWNLPIYNLGKLDGRIYDWGKTWYLGLIDLSVWISIIVLSILFCKKIYKHFKLICTFGIIILILSIGFEFILYSDRSKEINHDDRDIYEIDESTMYDFSKKENVIFIIIDEMQSDIFYELLDKENYRTLFDGFTYYLNTVGGSSYTSVAVPQILTGQCYDNSVPYANYIIDAYKNNSIPKVFMDNGFRVELYPKFSSWIMLINKNIMSNLKEKDRQFSLRNNFYLIDITLFRSIFYFLKQFVYNNNLWLFSGMNIIENTTQINKEKGKMEKVEKKRAHVEFVDDDIDFIKDFKESMTTESSRPVFKFYHLYGAHGPYATTRDGEYKRPDMSRKDYEETVVYRFKVLDDMLNKFRENKIYDSSTIVVLGDHGSARSRFTRVWTSLMGYSYSERMQIIPTWVKGRGVPFFMIKEKNAHGSVKINNEPFSFTQIPDLLFSKVANYRKFNYQKTNNNVEDNLPHSTIEPQQNVEDNHIRKFMHFDYSLIEGPYRPPLYEYHVDDNLSWLDSSWTGPYKIHMPGEEYELVKEIYFGKGGNSADYKKEGLAETDFNYCLLTGKTASIYISPVESNKKGLLFVRLYKPTSFKTKTVWIYINDYKLDNWVFNQPYDETGPVVYELFEIEKELYNNDSFKVSIKHDGGVQGFLGIKCIQFYTLINR